MILNLTLKVHTGRVRERERKLLELLVLTQLSSGSALAEGICLSVKMQFINKVSDADDIKRKTSIRELPESRLFE